MPNVGEDFEGNWPSPFWQQLTNCATWAHQNGQNVELVVDQAPPPSPSSLWPNGAGPTENVISPGNFQDFANVMGTLAADYNPAQYPSIGVNAIEIWNEADTDKSPYTDGWGGTEASYETMLCDAYSQIHQWAPSITVLSAGTANLDYSWDSTLLNEGGGSCFNAMATHPYPKAPASTWNNPAEYLNGSDNGNNTLSKLATLGKPIWFTEEGFHSDQIGSGSVATALADFYNYIDGGCAGCSSVQVAMWYAAYAPSDTRSIFSATVDQNGHYLSFNPLSAFTAFTNPTCYPSRCS
jgi:hypothetical protein